MREEIAFKHGKVSSLARSVLNFNGHGEIARGPVEEQLDKYRRRHGEGQRRGRARDPQRHGVSVLGAFGFTADADHASSENVHHVHSKSTNSVYPESPFYFFLCTCQIIVDEVHSSTLVDWLCAIRGYVRIRALAYIRLISIRSMSRTPEIS